MKAVYAKHRKLILVLGLILLAAALVWAAAELSGQANSLAQDAGSNSADMEMVTLNTIKKPAKTKDSPKPPPCDWKKERSIKKAIDAEDAKYKRLRSKAKSELNATGKVSGGTKSAVMSSANTFKKLCYDYAAMWDACKCRTRAKTARKSGDSRIKSAEVLVGGDIDEGKLKAMQRAQDDMKAARREYVKKATAGGEISDQDKSDLKSTVVPQIKSLMGQTQALVSGSTNLLTDIQKGATGGGLSGLTKMTKSAASGGSGSVAKTLLKPVTALVSVAKSMLSNVQALFSDAQSLIAGKVTGGGGGTMGGLPCFVGASEE
jgi:hypothetical protein